MANVKKQKGIILLSKEKLDFYQPDVPNVLSLPYAPNIIRSMDVVDKVALAAYIRSFIQTNKIPPSSLSFILHESLLFEKVISAAPSPLPPPTNPAPAQKTDPVPQNVPPNPSAPQTVKAVKPVNLPTPEEEDRLIQQFVDTVPFDEVLTKTVKLPQGKVVIVANKSLVMHMKESFEKEGFSIENVYPMTTFGKEIHVENGLTPQAAGELLAKVDSMRPNNMLIEEKKQVEMQSSQMTLGMPKKDSEKKRLFVMVGVFGILIIILVVLFFRMSAENAKISAQPARTVAKKAKKPVPQVTQVIPTTPQASASAVAAEITVQVTNNSQTASLVAQLRKILTDQGYTKVSVNQSTITTTKKLVIFSRDIPQDLRTSLVNSLASKSADLDIQETLLPEKTILITL